MEVRKVLANEKLTNHIGKVALQRGPIMYCAEWADNNGRTSNIIIPAATSFSTEFKPGLLNGIMTLKAEVPVVNITNNESSSTQKQILTARGFLFRDTCPPPWSKWTRVCQTQTRGRKPILFCCPDPPHAKK